MNTRFRWLPQISALTLLVSLPATAQTVQVVATGLNNPRGLGFAPNGELYVAEAGSGGTGTCRPSPDGQPVDVCYGETGALTRIDPQGLLPPVRVLQNLPSMAAAGGFAASSGPVDVDFFGMTAFVVMGWGGDPSLRAGVGPKGALFGTLLRALPNGRYAPVSDVAGNELRHNPAGGRIDSNPYGGVALPGRRVVADAGANALIAFSASDTLGSVADHTLAVLPPTAFGTEPVPTTIIAGPDGYLYVGQLTGAPFFRGSSTIYRIPPQGGTAVPYVTGLTAVVDIAFDHAGTLYVVEIASGFVPPPAGSGDPGVGNGRLLRIRQGDAPEVLLSGLVFPAGVAVGPDNALYVTNFGIFPGGGQVLRVTE
jgi:hypothetical protein